MRNNGVYQYFYKIGITALKHGDCRGIDFQDSSQTINVLFMSNDPNFKPLASQYLGSSLGTGYFATSVDAILIQYKENGILTRAKEIAFAANGVKMPN